MKVVRDLSVTAAAPNMVAVAWDAPWGSPLTQSNPGLILDFAAGVYGKGGVHGTLAANLTLSRSSVATYFDNQGVLATAAVDGTRIDHDPNSHAPTGLLLERAATNLVLQSEAPADQTITVTATSHVLSFYGDGMVTLSGAHVDSVVGTGAFPNRTQYAFTPTAGDVTLTFSGTVSNVQLEEGAKASSFISTAAVAGQRADDMASVSVGPWFAPTEGTLVFSGKILDASANDRIIEIDAGDTATRLSILWNTTLGKPQFQVWDGGSLQAAIAPGGNAVGLDNHFRVAIAFSENDFAISLNGSPIVSDTLGSFPAGLSTVRLARSIWGAQGLVEAESLVYYPLRLADAEVQALSS